jgi:hypothetical protein
MSQKKQLVLNPDGKILGIVNNLPIQNNPLGVV